MDLMTIANALVEGCRTEREVENLDRLYAGDAVSVEAFDMGMGRETHGLDGIKGKHDWFNSAHEITGHETIGPFPHGEDRFAVIFKAQGIEKESGKPFDMEEVAVYHVADGKIVREEFFYTGEM